MEYVGIILMIAVLLTAMITVAKNAGGLKENSQGARRPAHEGNREDQVGSARLPATHDEPEYG